MVSVEDQGINFVAGKWKPGRGGPHGTGEMMQKL
jgi:hypothetical protein